MIILKKAYTILPLAAGILFGSVGVFVRTLVAAGFNNATVLFARTAVAALIIFVFQMVYDRSLLRIRLCDLPLFIGSGVFGMMGLNLCYNEAINSLSLSLAAVLLSTAPLFVMIAAAFLFDERLTKRKVLCFVAAIIGCTLASGLFEQSSVSVSVPGVLFGIAAAAFFSFYSVCSRYATDRGYHTYTVVFYSALFTAIALVPFADYNAIGSFVALDPLGNGFFLVLHALCTSALPYFFITLGFQRGDAGIVSIITSGAEPTAALMFWLVFFSEVPTPLMLAGFVIVVSAIIVLSLPQQESEAG